MVKSLVTISCGWNQCLWKEKRTIGTGTWEKNNFKKGHFISSDFTAGIPQAGKDA